MGKKSRTYYEENSADFEIDERLREQERSIAETVEVWYGDLAHNQEAIDEEVRWWENNYWRQRYQGYFGGKVGE